MVIQPFNYQKRTNIEEHNQIVDKLNEVVDAVNDIVDPSGQGLEPRVTALETDVTDLGVRVDSVESKNLQQDTAITDIRADAETTKNRLGAAETDINTVTGQVTQLETDTTNLDGRVTDIDGRLTTLAGNYTALGGRVDTLNTEVGQLTTKTTNLETGKVNVAQGVANAGKYLKVSNEGNVVTEANEVYGGEWKLLGSAVVPANSSAVGFSTTIPPTASYALIGRVRAVKTEEFDFMGEFTNNPYSNFSIAMLDGRVSKHDTDENGNIILNINVGIPGSVMALDRTVDIYAKPLGMGELFITCPEVYNTVPQARVEGIVSGLACRCLDSREGTENINVSFDGKIASFSATFNRVRNYDGSLIYMDVYGNYNPDEPNLGFSIANTRFTVIKTDGSVVEGIPLAMEHSPNAFTDPNGYQRGKMYIRAYFEFDDPLSSTTVNSYRFTETLISGPKVTVN